LASHCPTDRRKRVNASLAVIFLLGVVSTSRPAM